MHECVSAPNVQRLLSDASEINVYFNNICNLSGILQDL